jgi:cathepsin L
MKLHALIFSAAVTLNSASNIEQDQEFPNFQRFVEAYGRRYSSQAEVEGRFAIFKDNLKLIHDRNNDGGTDVHGVNKFADIHPQEFRSMFNGARLIGSHESALTKEFNQTELTAKTSNIDWRTRGAVTPVKNQGQCGSCWAFSAAEQIESDVFLDTGTLFVLSPQQIVSCDTVDLGCNGGNPINAYGYVNGTGGLDTSETYPYTSGVTQANGVCNFHASDIAKHTAPTGYYLISQQASQEKNMVAQIQHSPMSVCVDATLWQTYQSGIISAADNCGTTIDHAVQVIGIGGAQTGTPYWIVRNSWAADWGNSGYIYVETGANVCGITAQATTTEQ